MNELIILQSSGLPETLSELVDGASNLFHFFLKIANLILIIWIVIVFATWRYVTISSFGGFLAGFIQSYFVFGVESGLISCSDAKAFLIFFCIFNIGAIIAIFTGGGSLFSFTFDTFNVMRDAFVYLFFACVTFAIINRPHNFAQFGLSEYFTWNNFLKTILPLYVCY